MKNRLSKFIETRHLAAEPEHLHHVAEVLPIPTPGTPANRGYKLFLMNCAHCHGSDARGDEGPDLHGVLKSDAKIVAMIKNGIKGEMPKFGAKFQAAEVNDLVAFIRNLKDD